MRAVALSLIAALALWPLEANGHCRSTTCTRDCARDERGCTIDGVPLWWASMCVGISLQRDGSQHIPFVEIEKALARSLSAWSDVECDGGTASLAFQRLADIACSRAEYDPGGGNANAILFRDSRWSYQGAHNTLARTTVTFDSDSGEILDADIELNHAYNELTVSDDVVEYDLQSILTHEIGHLVGLDHSRVPGATMSAAYERHSTELRTLEADDRAGLCAAYPPWRGAVCRATPRGGLRSECSSEVGGGCNAAGRDPGGATTGWLMTAVGLAALVWRRRW